MLNYNKMKNLNVVIGNEVNFYDELMEKLMLESSKKEGKSKKGYNSYFKDVLIDKVMSKEVLINSVLIKCFKDRMGEDLSLENMSKFKKEIESIKISIGNSIDSNKSYSDLNNRGYYLEGLRLLKDSNSNYYLEVIK